MKVMLITGASRGLGKVLYDYFSMFKDYHVYGTSRNPNNNDLLTLDITSDASVSACINEVYDKEKRIDVLINNVGSNLIGSFEATTMTDFQKEMNLNFYGAFRMMREILPYFRQVGEGRIINISSIGGRVPLPYNSTYAASKAALEAMSESLAYDLSNDNIYVSLIEPIGLTIDGEMPTIKYVSEEKPLHQSSQHMFKKMQTKSSPSVTKLRVAQRIHKIILLEKPKLRYPVGKGSRIILLLHNLLPYRIFKRIIQFLM